MESFVGTGVALTSDEYVCVGGVAESVALEFESDPPQPYKLNNAIDKTDNFSFMVSYLSYKIG
ncbi:hypothetical protein TI24_03535 [Vibrio vulnificus]|nr:hypothetical protein VVCECT4999_20420 [Vibrio vulnificus]PNG71031.1 hypothetical protein TI24_03535 [Vibrio vulnificus]PNG77068.1 hypothetical protein TI31_04720 [Vibrio vulnificus]POC31789.1 hypothetical protein CRN50_16485 [Vibrio vulnificus]